MDLLLHRPARFMPAGFSLPKRVLAQGEVGFSLSAIWRWVRRLLYCVTVCPADAVIRAPELTPKLILN